MKKKILLALLSLQTAALSLTGCGDDTNPANNGPAGESEDAYKELRSPEATEMERIQSLALQLQLDTEEAYRKAYEAATANGHVSAQEQEALEHLYRLKIMAAEYNGSIDEYYDNPVETRFYFYQLNRIFVEAQPRFVHLGVYVTYQPLFETIIDCFGNFRLYYVVPGRYAFLPVVDVYPYYPGHPRWNVFVGVGVIHDHFHFRHPRHWHLHVDHYRIYPHREVYIRTNFSWYFDFSISVRRHGWVAGHTHFHTPRPRYVGFNAEFGKHAGELKPLLKNPQYRTRAERFGPVDTDRGTGRGVDRNSGRVTPGGNQPGNRDPRRDSAREEAIRNRQAKPGQPAQEVGGQTPHSRPDLRGVDRNGQSPDGQRRPTEGRPTRDRDDDNGPKRKPTDK